MAQLRFVVHAVGVNAADLVRPAEPLFIAAASLIPAQPAAQARALAHVHACMHVRARAPPAARIRSSRRADIDWGRHERGGPNGFAPNGWAP